MVKRYKNISSSSQSYIYNYGPLVRYYLHLAVRSSYNGIGPNYATPLFLQRTMESEFCGRFMACSYNHPLDRYQESRTRDVTHWR